MLPREENEFVSFRKFRKVIEEVEYFSKREVYLHRGIVLTPNDLFGRRWSSQIREGDI